MFSPPSCPGRSVLPLSFLRPPPGGGFFTPKRPFRFLSLSYEKFLSISFELAIKKNPVRIASHGIEGLEPERPQGGLVKEALLLRVHFLRGGAQKVRGLQSGVGALRERTDRHVGIVEPGAVDGRPVFPIDVGRGVELAGFCELLFGHVHGEGEFKRVEHVVHAGFGFAQFARVVAVHRVDRGVHLLFRLVGVAGQAGFLDVVTRRRGPVVRVGRAVGLLHLGHVAGSAGGARLVVLRTEEGFGVGVLQFHELGARQRVLEVAVADLVVVGFDVVGVDPREEVRETAVHADGFARAGFLTRVADVFDVALRAHQTAVGAVHRGDFAGEAANAGVLDRELGGIGGVITIDVRAVLAFHRVDERVAHHARLRRMRIVAEVAVDAVVDGADHIDGVRAAVELGAVDLVAHVGPVEHQVGRLAGPADGVARGGGAGLKGLVFVGFGMVVLEDVPDLVGLAAFQRRVEPAFLRFETAAEGAVDDELVDRHEGVGARKVVLLREAVRPHGAVKEGVGRGTRGVLLRLAGRTIARRKKRLVLIGMAGAAGGRVKVDRRTRLHVGEMLIQTRVAGRAGDVLVRRAGVILGDRAVAGGALREVGGRSGHGKAQAEGREHERQRGMSEHSWGLPVCNRLSGPIACRFSERLDSMGKPCFFPNNFFKN